MRRTARTGLGLLGVAAIVASHAAIAATLDCNARGLSRTETTICGDAQLARLDAQLERRLDGFARRLGLGQYLGLRHWQAGSVRRRDQCGADRSCITAHYRAQARFLDRLQQCTETTLSRNRCLRQTLAGDREVRR